MSALYGTMNAHITMKAGSAITAPAVTDRVKSAKPPKDETGAAGAVWLQGAEFIMESGAEIHDMVGRAVYCDGGTATIGGTIFNLKGDKDMWQGTAGVAVHVRGDADATLVSGGKIHSIQAGKDENDTVIATYSSDFTMDKGSEISGLTDVTAIYADDKIGMTIEEAADYTGIGRNTLRRLVDWGKIPVLRIGRKSIVRVDVMCCFMQINEGRDLLDRNQVLAVK